ncbi:MAG TPA: LLM class flavin-dependent oxidoreductase [Polyangia bacterium]
MLPLSILDLAPVVQGGSASQTLRNSLELAQHAETWGYRRIWFAEHHNMPGVASAATAVVIAHVAGGTKTIRVGAGGIMLPNHAPLMIAEQFGTLASLFPDRIDLGLGRAPGTDQRTMRALRRNLAGDVDSFPDDVSELMNYLGDAPADQPVTAFPGVGTNVPIWILGSSLFGAQVAASFGLPFAFASHFAPAALAQAVQLYRAHFQPSSRLDRPYVMLGINVFAADSDQEAALLATSLQQAFVQLRRGRPTRLPPPLPDFYDRLLPHERAMLDEALSCTFVGAPSTIAAAVRAFVARTGADELIVGAHIFDHQARLRSYQLLAEVNTGPR